MPTFQELAPLFSPLSLLFALSMRAPQETLPAADAILAKLESAVGDPAARAKVANLAISGKVTMGELAMSAKFDELYLGPTQVKWSVDWGGGGGAEGADWAMTQGTTGTWAWTTDPALGVTIKEGDEMLSAVRQYQLGRRASWKEMYASAETTGKAEHEKRPHWVLRMQPKVGSADTWYVDCETNVLSRVDVELPNPTGGMFPMRFDYADYKRVGGVAYPHLKKQVVGDIVLQFVTEKIEQPHELDPARVAPPADVLAAYADPKKRAVEAPQKPGECTIQTVEPQLVLSVRTKVAPNQISQILATILPEVYGYASKAGAAMSGPPFSRYHSFGPGELDVEAGMPVKNKVAGEGRVQASELPGGRVVVYWHFGPYHELTKSYKRVEEWMKEQKLEARGGPWEIYWTDPGIEPDPSKWRTQILFPIQ